MVACSRRCVFQHYMTRALPIVDCPLTFYKLPDEHKKFLMQILNKYYNLKIETIAPYIERNTDHDIFSARFLASIK